MNVRETTKMLNDVTDMDWGEALYYDGDLIWKCGKDTASYDQRGWRLTISGLSSVGMDLESAYLDIQSQRNYVEPDHSLWDLPWESRKRGHGVFAEVDSGSAGAHTFLDLTPREAYIESEEGDGMQTVWDLRMDMIGFLSLESLLDELRRLSEMRKVGP
jgi:hypothetical protein